MSRAAVVMPDPDMMERAGRTLAEQARLLRDHARACADGAARQADGWQGAAGMEFAVRCGEHVRLSRAAAGALDGLATDAVASAAVMRRLVEEVHRRTTEIDRLKAERASIAALQASGGLLQTDLAHLRLEQQAAELNRRIRALDELRTAAEEEIRRKQEEVSEKIAGVGPKGLKQWWEVGTGITDLWDTRLLKPLWSNHRARVVALAAGEAEKAEEAAKRILQTMRKAQSTIIVDGLQHRMVAAVREAAKDTEKAARAAGAQKVVSAVDGIRRTPAGKIALRALSPVGIALTIGQGTKDVITGGEEKSLENRLTGALEVGGSIAMLFPPTAVAGTAVVLGVGAYKGVRALMKNPTVRRKAKEGWTATEQKAKEGWTATEQKAKEGWTEVERKAKGLPWKRWADGLRDGGSLVDEQDPACRKERAPGSVERLRCLNLSGAVAA